AEAQSRCLAAWHDARAADDFAPFARAFAPLLALRRREAEAIGGGDEPYDALLEEFEPGARAADLAPLFARLVERLGPIVDGARDRGPAPLPPRHWPADRQRAITEDVARLMGFDLSAGVVGVSAHPFTVQIHAGDVRFSTSFDEASPVKNILVTLHEGGHAVYDQGFPADHARTLLYTAPSLGAQESQSRFYEMHVGGEATFWEAIAPRLREVFPDEMRGVAPEDLRREAFAVTPGAVRLEADEVTYNLHIAVRFELERALVRGDLPVAWAERVDAALGVRPSGHRDGVLQDIHWASGLIGYFPTYTLGNIYAAQLRARLEEEMGPLDALIRDGAFPEILAFMRQRVHSVGRRVDTGELMRRATGRELGIDELVAHLERRHLP
ncbi:MAG: carboxypeptidase M32, partial [Actinomycetota bacterium]